MNKQIRDLCPAASHGHESAVVGSRPAIHPSVVYPCQSVEEANRKQDGLEPGYVYQRNGHPNADALAERCRQLHRADAAVITSTGMSAMALAMIASLQQGDHVVLSSQLYGKSSVLFTTEAARLGITHTVVDTSDLAATAQAFTPTTRLVICETISNPTMRVCDIRGLSEVAHRHSALMLVDNTFASPVICRPLEWGADLVLESLTKIMNGHSDAMLGLLCGKSSAWSRVGPALETWGWTSSPFDCWLVDRGMGTLHLRVVTASRTAEQVANFLSGHPRVAGVSYPGLIMHPDHWLALEQFDSDSSPLFGHMLSFEIRGGEGVGSQFISRLVNIQFCASLGELATTVSHPASTSHRNMDRDSQAALGISGGTIRLSIGLESPEFVESELANALDTLDD
jgi:cystathionine beta-lyase/cystathionine gamma-synthase